MADDGQIEIRFTAINDTQSGADAAAASTKAATDQMNTSMADLRAGQVGAAAASNELGSAGGKAAQGLKNLAGAGHAAGEGLNVGATGMREFIVLAHELVTGRFSRVPGSIMVLTSRMNGLGTVLNFIKSPMGLITGAALALGAGLAYIAYQAHETKEALEGVAGAAQAQGLGGTQAADIDSLRQHFEQMRQTFDLSGKDARNVETAFTKLPAAVRPYAQALMDVAVLQSQVSHSDLKKSAEEVDRAAQSGAAGLLKYAEAGNYLTVSQQTAIESMIKGGSTQEALTAIVGILTQKVLDYGGATEIARDKTEGWLTSLAGLATTFEQASAASAGIVVPTTPYEKTPNLPKPGTEAPKEAPETPEHAEHARAVTQVNSELIKQQDLQAQIKTIQGAIADSVSDWSRGLVQGNALLQQQGEQETKNAELAKQALEYKLQEIHTPVQTRQFETSKAGIEEQIKQDQGNPQKQIQDYRNLAALETQYYHEGSTQAIEAQNRVTDAVRKNASDQIEYFAQTARAQADLSNRGSDARVAAEKSILAKMQQVQQSGPAGAVTPQQIGEQQMRLANAQRQASQEAYRNFAEGQQENITASKGAVSQIISAYETWLDKAKNLYNQDARTLEQIKRQEVSAVQAAYAQMYSSAMENVDAASTIFRLQQSAYERSQKAMVSEHKITTQQELQDDLAYYTASESALKGLMESVAQSNNLTAQEKQSLNIKLLELDDQYAQKHAEIMEQIAAADKAKLEKEEQEYKQFFNSVGSAMESFLAAGLARSETYRAAIKKLFDSVVNSAVHSAGNILSQAAAGPLGKFLGVKAQPGQGIGGVLTSFVTEKIFGMKKPDTAQDKNTSALSNNTAALNKLPAELRSAIQSSLQNLNSKLLSQGPGSGPAGTGLGATTLSDDQVAALVRQHESNNNYNVGFGGTNLANAPLGPNGFPQWAGAMGPSGMSHAAGAYQFEPGTWNPVAQQLGIHDFSQQSQDRVFQAVYAQQGIKPWQSDKGLMQAYNSTTTGSQTAQTQDAVRQGVTTGMSQATPQITTAVSTGTNTGNQQVATADASLNQSVTENTSATKQNTTGMQTASAGAGGSGSGSPSLMGSATGLLGAVGKFVPGVGQIAGMISGVQNVFKGLQSLGSAVQPAVSALTGLSTASQTASQATNLVSTGMKTASSATTVVNSAMSTTSTATTLLGTANTANTAATTANTVATEANSATSGGILGGLFGFSGGGIVPSAAGGMITGAGGGARLAILHPQEMVLPSRLSTGIQSAVASGSFGGGGSQVNNHNSGNTNLTYAPTLQGMAPFMTRGGVEAMLRQHGTEMMKYARNATRNNSVRFA